MSTQLFVRDGVYISTYAGPIRDDGGPRTRVQITNMNNFQGKSDVLTLSLTDWAALCAGVRELGTTNIA